MAADPFMTNIFSNRGSLYTEAYARQLEVEVDQLRTKVDEQAEILRNSIEREAALRKLSFDSQQKYNKMFETLQEVMDTKFAAGMLHQKHLAEQEAKTTKNLIANLEKSLKDAKAEAEKLRSDSYRWAQLKQLLK